MVNLFAQQFESVVRNPGTATFILLGALVVITMLGTRRGSGEELRVVAEFHPPM